MQLKEALEILKPILDIDSEYGPSLNGYFDGAYVNWQGVGDHAIRLDGSFEPSTIKALACFLEHYDKIQPISPE